MPKLVPAPFIAYNRSVSFSGRTAPTGWCWLGTKPTQRTWPESTLTITAPIIASHASPCSQARCPMPPCSHSPAPTLRRALKGTVKPAAIALVMISPVLQPLSATTKEPGSEPDVLLSSTAVRMCTWSKAPMSTETTLDQIQ
jgi:hypothetical protein